MSSIVTSKFESMFCNMMHLDRNVKNISWWVKMGQEHNYELKSFDSKQELKDYLIGLDGENINDSLGTIASRLAKNKVIMTACYSGNPIYN